MRDICYKATSERSVSQLDSASAGKRLGLQWLHMQDH